MSKAFPGQQKNTRAAALFVSVVVIVACLSVERTSAVDRNNFKTCEQSGFCT